MRRECGAAGVTVALSLPNTDNRGLHPLHTFTLWGPGLTVCLHTVYIILVAMLWKDDAMTRC